MKQVMLLWTSDSIDTESDMSIFDKAKGISDKVMEKAVDFSSDELIADTIIKAVEKQEKINRILQERGSNYRITDLELGMGVPPSVAFSVTRLAEDQVSRDESQVSVTD